MPTTPENVHFDMYLYDDDLYLGPDTTRLEGPESLEKMLDLYDSIYLKPQTGRFGNGIQKIEKTQRGICTEGNPG